MEENLSPEGQVSPFDTRAEESELAALEQEIKQSEASLENDFATFASENLSEADEELFFNDKAGFIKKILALQNEFLQSRYQSKVNRAGELKDSIKTKKAQASIEEAEKAFLAKYPDADINAMIAFYEEELGPRYKKELDKLPPEQFFEVLYQIYTQRIAGQKSEPEEESPEQLPKNIKGNNADVEQSNFNDEELPMNRL